MIIKGVLQPIDFIYNEKRDGVDVVITLKDGSFEFEDEKEPTEGVGSGKEIEFSTKRLFERLGESESF